MKPREWIGAAKTAEDAVRKGLKKLNLVRGQVDIEVLGEKKSGLFSLFGLRRIEVKLVEKPAAHVFREREDDYDYDRPRRGRGDRPREGGRRDGRDEGRRPGGPRGSSEGQGGRGGRGQDRGPQGGRGGRPGEGRPQSGREDFRSDRPNRDSREDRGQGRGGREGQGGGRRDDRGGAPRRDDFSRGDRGGRPPVPPRREDADAPQRPPREVPSAEALLSEWKSLLGWDDLSWSPKNGETGDIVLVLDEAASERLLADNGEPLEALAHLLNIVRSRGDRSVPRVFLELGGRLAPESRPDEGREGRSEGRRGGRREGRRDSRRDDLPGDRQLVNEAMSAADEVKRSGAPFRLAPMSPRDRRIVHQALADHPDVETSSEGDGPDRKVVVKPKSRSV